MSVVAVEGSCDETNLVVLRIGARKPITRESGSRIVKMRRGIVGRIVAMLKYEIVKKAIMMPATQLMVAWIAKKVDIAYLVGGSDESFPHFLQICCRRHRHWRQHQTFSLIMRKGF